MNRIAPLALSCLFALAPAACGPSIREEADAGPPADAGPEPDAFDCAAILDEDLRPALCADGCTSLLYDPDNCGACGRSCSYVTGDDCYQGQCRCSEHAGCTAPAVCQNGLCLEPDPGGMECDGIDIPCPYPLICVGGRCTEPVCSPEVCDGQDNDCDGDVDENADDSGPISEWCYSGPLGTDGIGECRRGTRLCQAGAWSACNGEVTPTTEVGLFSCDSLDNDCDNCPDGVWIGGVCQIPPAPDIDIVFFIDTSGSMYSYIMATINAVMTFASGLSSNPQVRLGIVNTSAYTTGYVEVVWPLDTFAAFSAALSGMSADGSGTEPTWDAVYLAATPGAWLHEELGFRDGSLRIFISFGDEDASGQTYLPVTETEMCAAATAGGAMLVVFTEPVHYGDWDECTSSTPMPPSLTPQTAFPLSTDPAEMEIALDLTLGSACVSGP